MGVHGLWPVGEGAGYAGGIMSAATDGILAAEKIVAGVRGKVAPCRSDRTFARFCMIAYPEIAAIRRSSSLSWFMPVRKATPLTVGTS